MLLVKLSVTRYILLDKVNAVYFGESKRGRAQMKENPLRIILLEDDMSYGRLVCAKLKDALPESSEMVHVTILHELLERLAKETFDVILLDLMVPDSWGIDTFQSVHDSRPDIPTVVLSGINDEYLAVSAVKLGAQDYLVKGKVDEVLLMRSIRYSIERKKVEEKLKQANEQLEKKVQERTVELSKANAQLLQEIAERKKAEEKLRYRLELEKLIAEVSANFISVPDEDVDQAIGLVLRAIGQFVGADQAYLYLFSPGGDKASLSSTWEKEGAAPAPQTIPASSLAWLTGKFRDINSVYCPDIAALPPQAAPFHELMLSQAIAAFIALPMRSTADNETSGYILFASETPKEWVGEDVSLFRIFAAIFANALDRKASAR